MANIQSAKKRNRQTIKKTIANKASMNELRTFVRKLEDNIQKGKKDDAVKIFSQVQSAIAKVGQKGIIHKNTASRKIARLYSQVKALS
jgi:small subunit ribosomal protein S20